MKLNPIRFAAAAMTFLLVSACSPGSGDKVSESSKAGVPDSYKSKPVQVATAVGLAPYEVFAKDGKTVEGFEPDYLNEMAKRVGVELEWVRTKYETLMPGVASGRYDIAANGMFNTPERSAQFTMLNYFGDSSTFLVPRGNPDSVGSFEDLCGKTVAVQAGSKYPEAVAKLSDQHCDSSGRRAIKTIAYGDAAGHVLLMKQRRADATATARLVADYATHVGDSDLEAVKETDFEATTYAVIFPKNSPLAGPFRTALQSMMDDGTYAEIAKKWGLRNGTLSRASIGVEGD